ncbi:MAG: hypothetical protein H6666_08190 [Ardenticatenaceae bacterium]|nr:hypothetical protein [Anaerolineales bacterium]MCB8917890.1 hypothetical protein [Ardenticatenaceae bacterium]
MAYKLIMQWDIQPHVESEYSDFVANEFIPSISRLGLTDIQAWYTVYGDCEQILVSGNTQTDKQMNYILSSDEWQRLKTRLTELVNDFAMKVVLATAGFQR